MKNETELEKDVSFLETMGAGSGLSASTMELHRSNLLRFEVEELMEEVTPKRDLSPTVQQYLTKLQAVLSKWEKTLNSKISRGSSVITLQKDGLSCPFVLRSDNKVTDVTFESGTWSSLRLQPCGCFGASSTLGVTNNRGNANMLPIYDVAIAIPHEVFHPKDYYEYRYMDKRNLILWAIAKHLAKNESIVGKVEWRYKNGNEMWPVLVLTHPIAAKDNNKEGKQPSKKQRKKRKQEKDEKMASQQPEKLPSKPKFLIQLHLVMDSLEWMSPVRLFPNRSNVKSTSNDENTNTSGSSVENSTPYYNSALAWDGIMMQDLTTIVSDQLEDTASENFHKAFCLCKIWLLQRGLVRCHDGLDEFHIALLLVYVYRTRKANPRMAPLQVFTVWIKLLSDHLFEKPCVIPDNEGRNEAQTIANCPHSGLYEQQSQDDPLDSIHGDPPSLLACYQQFRHDRDVPILLDSSMRCNVLGMLSPSYCRALQRHATLSLSVLQSAANHALSYLFMSNARFWNQMEAFMRIPITVAANATARAYSSGRSRGLPIYEAMTRTILAKLKEALGDRVLDMRFLSTGNGDTRGTDGSDEIPSHRVFQHGDGGVKEEDPLLVLSPLNHDSLVLGIQLDPETCLRSIDRGPPADDKEASKRFCDLWGDAAEIRRFKDGAIVYAVIWEKSVVMSQNTNTEIMFEEDEKIHGGHVERIVQHILKTHFGFGENKAGERRKELPSFLLRDMLGLLEGVVSPTNDKLLSNSFAAHRSVITAFESLSTFLRENSKATMAIHGSELASKLGIPLPIDAVEPLSTSLRYADLFPPTPHPFLGAVRSGGRKASEKKVTGALCYPSIRVQIRFSRSAKWPNDIKAMAAAKTAMLIQLANGIELMQTTGAALDFDGPIVVTSTYMEVGFRGYCWRISIRADPEIYLLRGLHNPTPEATVLLQQLTRDNIVVSSHHSMIHSIHTSNPTAAAVVRLAHRWLASHLLSGLIPTEALELTVAYIYSRESSPLLKPATVTAGFLRWLDLLVVHDWLNLPLIVDPHGFISDDDVSDIQTNFEQERGPNKDKGPPMYIVSPCDRVKYLADDDEEHNNISLLNGAFDNLGRRWSPSFTRESPEWVSLSRTVALAERSRDYIRNKCLKSVDGGDWSSVFQESATSLKSYSCLMKVDPDHIVDGECSSTSRSLGSLQTNNVTSYMRSMKNRDKGPKPLRLCNYRNVTQEAVLFHFCPTDTLVEKLRREFGKYALFFYNRLSPEVIGMVWRPAVFVKKMPFSVMHSEWAQPITMNADEKSTSRRSKSEDLIIQNQSDMMRLMSTYVKDIVVDVKLMDDRRIKCRNTAGKKRKEPAEQNTDSESDSDSSAK